MSQHLFIFKLIFQILALITLIKINLMIIFLVFIANVDKIEQNVRDSYFILVQTHILNND